MFSAAGYLEERYPEAKEYSQKLQDLVNASRLQDEDDFVTDLLNAVTSEAGDFAGDMREIRRGIAAATAMWSLGEPWKRTLTNYLSNLPDEDMFDAAEFYKCAIAPRLDLDKDLTIGKKVVRYATPAVLAYPPTVETSQFIQGQIAGKPFKPPTLQIDFGLFGFMTTLCASGEDADALDVGLLQFVASSRIATYEGETVIKHTFPSSLDASRPPWYKGQSDSLDPGKRMILCRDDSPKWAVPDRWNGRPLDTVAITDTFKTYLAARVAEYEYVTLFTCEWNFSTEYNRRAPEAAKAAYVLTSQRTENVKLRITGQEKTAQTYKEKITS
ncbi:hypothetical protein [Nonomuraea diastatica]|uniref:Uncharacterized protein n=1 Tax=Nonomuraea diastatica TaxID=1848329 RepID=A0A4V2YE87_9ACTN|nr:hypothetical protein [Nonomuraea diastatica]TDD18296.1 hypothetical protein E1294_24795 [Nonomuraea diastatica]